VGNLFLECFVGSGEAQLYTVLFLSSLSHALPFYTLIDSLGDSMSGKRGCSVSENISVVSQMNHTINGRESWG